MWLSLEQLADLFEKNKSTISRHIKNIFTEGELFSNSVVANFATTASDGKTYNVSYYNLDVIISVGYRVKSKRGIAAGAVGINAEDVLKVIQEYSRALQLLDDYDHQCIKQPEGTTCAYQLQYEECMDLIRKMDFSKDSTIFGTEKEPGKLEGILSAIHQSAFGQDVYPTLEEKAANLLYFIIKDHAFNDGCKRSNHTIDSGI